MYRIVLSTQSNTITQAPFLTALSTAATVSLSVPSQDEAAWKHLRFLLIAHIYSVPQTRELRLEHLRSGMQLKIFSYLCTVLHY